MNTTLLVSMPNILIWNFSAGAHSKGMSIMRCIVKGDLPYHDLGGCQFIVFMTSRHGYVFLLALSLHIMRIGLEVIFPIHFQLKFRKLQDKLLE
jgi:hypothetical protein